MMVSNELLNFTNSEKSFYENNLLDADDWGNNLSAAFEPFDSSPTSSSESDTFGDYNPQSYFLNEDDTETWLNETLPMNSIASDKVSLVKEEPPSSPPSKTEIIDNDIIPQAFSKHSNFLPISSEFKNMPKLLTLNEITNELLGPLEARNKGRKDSNRKIIQTKKQRPESLINILPSTKGKTTINGNANVITPPISLKSIIKVGKITNKNTHQNMGTIVIPAGESGQYYVAPSLPTPTSNKKIHVSLSKPILKRPSDIKVEHLLSDTKDFAELKNAKRQQRMMKNRESACLSRQRKKQHLKTLEERVTVIMEMNQKLKIENDTLKRRIELLEIENKELRDQPTGRQIKPNLKKATLLCVLFVFFGFQVFRQKLTSQDEVHKFHNRMPSYVHRGRSLLQHDNSNINTYDSMIHKGGEYDIIDRSFNFERKKRIIKEKKHSKFMKVNKFEKVNITKKTNEWDDCEGHFNQSHLSRINKDLEGLVYGLRKGKNKKKQKKTLRKLLSSNSTAFSKDNEDNCNQTKGKKADNRLITTASTMKFLRTPGKLKKPLQSNDPNSIKEVDNTIQELASLVQKSITRKSDTFYVISLIRDMLILPATNFSSTHRPKLTFMLPAYLPHQGNDTQINGDGKLPIIQIDCNVVDTKLTDIKGSSLSKHLLTHFIS